MSNIHITSCKVGNQNIPLSQIFRADEYRSFFPNLLDVFPSINDFTIDPIRGNKPSIVISFSEDINLTLSDISSYSSYGCIKNGQNKPGVPDGAIYPRRLVTTPIITKISDNTFKLDDLQGIGMANNNIFTLAIGKNIRQPLLKFNDPSIYSSRLLQITNDTIFIFIMTENTKNILPCIFRDQTPSISPTITPTIVDCNSFISPNVLEFIADPSFDIVLNTDIADCHEKCFIEIEIIDIDSNKKYIENHIIPNDTLFCLNRCSDDKGYKIQNNFYITYKTNNLIVGNRHILKSSIQCIPKIIKHTIPIINNDLTISDTRYKCCPEVSNTPSSTPTTTPTITPTPSNIPSCCDWDGDGWIVYNSSSCGWILHRDTFNKISNNNWKLYKTLDCYETIDINLSCDPNITTYGSLYSCINKWPMQINSMPCSNPPYTYEIITPSNIDNYNWPLDIKNTITSLPYWPLSCYCNMPPVVAVNGQPKTNCYCCTPTPTVTPTNSSTPTPTPTVSSSYMNSVLLSINLIP